MRPQKLNSGVLFGNSKRTDRDPDATGLINVDGQHHRLSAWWHEGTRGNFLSISVSPVPADAFDEAQPPPPVREERPRYPKQDRHQRYDPDDEAPF